MWYHGAAQHTSLGSDEVAVLFDPGNHREVLREISGDDAADPFLLKLLRSVKYWGQKRRRSNRQEFRRNTTVNFKTPSSFSQLNCKLRKYLDWKSKGERKCTPVLSLKHRNWERNRQTEQLTEGSLRQQTPNMLMTPPNQQASVQAPFCFTCLHYGLEERQGNSTPHQKTIKV